MNAALMLQWVNSGNFNSNCIDYHHIHTYKCSIAFTMENISCKLNKTSALQNNLNSSIDMTIIQLFVQDQKQLIYKHIHTCVQAETKYQTRYHKPAFISFFQLSVSDSECPTKLTSFFTVNNDNNWLTDNNKTPNCSHKSKALIDSYLHVRLWPPSPPQAKDYSWRNDQLACWNCHTEWQLDVMCTTVMYLVCCTSNTYTINLLCIELFLFDWLRLWDPGSFPAGTPGNGVPRVILTVGTAFHFQERN